MRAAADPPIFHRLLRGLGSTRGHRVATAYFAAVALLTGPTRGAAPSSEAQADELFRQGQSLLQAGRTREACARLGDSLRLDPALGTLLNLALCHEREGRTATAHREYAAAGMWATQRREADRERFAKGRVVELEKRLSKIRFEIAVTSHRLGVKLDGRSVDGAQLETDIAVDPGTHRLEVTGAGRKDGSRRDLWIELPGVTVVRLALDEEMTHGASTTPRTDGDSMMIDAMPAAERADDVVSMPSKSSQRRTLGYVVGGAGIAALGVGIALLLRAGALDGESEREAERARRVSPPDPAGKSAAYEHYDAAVTSQNLGIAAAGAGILGVSASLYLLLSAHPTEPAATRRAMRISPHVAPNGASVKFEARF